MIIKDKQIKMLQELNEAIKQKRIEALYRIDELNKQIEELKTKTTRQSKNYKNDVEFLLRQIANLEAQIEELKKSNLELLDFYEKKLNKVTELETQIEKMKCCDNCGKRFDCGSSGYVCDKWVFYER